MLRNLLSFRTSWIILLFLSVALPTAAEDKKVGGKRPPAIPIPNLIPPPASIDPTKRPEVWRDFKPRREGDPLRIPSPHAWHNAVQYHDDYVYARGWVFHFVGGVSGDGDVCFDMTLDEPYLGLRNHSNKAGGIHCEIDSPGNKSAHPNGSRYFLYKSVGVPPPIPGLMNPELKEAEDRLFRLFVSKLLGNHVEVLGVWANDTGHKANDPWLEIHPCVGVRILNVGENEKRPKIDIRGRITAEDKERDEKEKNETDKDEKE